MTRGEPCWWLLALLCLSLTATCSAGETSPGVGEVERELCEFAAHYRTARGDSISLVMQIEISPDRGVWHVVCGAGSNVALEAGPHEEAAFALRMSDATLARIYEGTMTAFTAAGKASGADVAPLEIETLSAAQSLDDPTGALLEFIQHFFARSLPERIALREECSRIVHGAHVIPLYYAHGFRSAWYRVKQGQRLNEPGDTNPFPQAFVIISGRGKAKIGDHELTVRAGESYYIPPGSDHILWTEDPEPIEVIWMAWGEGA